MDPYQTYIVRGATIDAHIFEVPEFSLEGGGTLSPARLSYKTYGSPSNRRDNTILFPTAFAARHYDNEWLIGPDRVFNSNRYYIIVPDLLGNGLSSSPSNYDGRFPDITVRDNVHLQKRLLQELQIAKVALVYGYSMGGQQAYEWTATYPELVARLGYACSASSVSPWQKLFLSGMRDIISLGGSSKGMLTGEMVTSVLARAWSAWGVTDEFYDQEVHREFEALEQEEFIQKYWISRFSEFDITDLDSMIKTWLSHDINNRPGQHSRNNCLSKINIPTLILQSTTDKYFRLEYAIDDNASLRHAHLVTFDSVWGHLAGRGVVSEDASIIHSALAQHLNAT